MEKMAGYAPVNKHLFAVINFTCTWQSNRQSSCNINPRTESWQVCGMPKTGVNTFVQLFFLITRSLHFLLLLDIKFFSHHFINVLTISSELSCSFHTRETILVSSAYLNRMSFPFKLISRSLRKMVNRWGPLTLPCVVLLLTSFHCPTNPSYNSLCFLPFKKLRYQMVM